MIASLKYALACNLYFNKKKDKIYTVTKKLYGVDISANIKKPMPRRFKTLERKDKSDWHDW